ncbi:MAG: right-handed parallel beta-helix repeat-containing protein [Candidatus Heimdallarchaeota archaeon]|nr:right-handed parallel beta-helix repeat-containing protein [Candidatus Heimdallarchaeota archaeon]
MRVQNYRIHHRRFISFIRIPIGKVKTLQRPFTYLIIFMLCMSLTFSQNGFNINVIKEPSSIYQIQTFSEDDNFGFFLNNLTEHDLIIIKSNEDFITYSLPGNGTINNPYRIENLNLTSENLIVYDYGIDISNTSKYFIIQNNFIDLYYGGITIKNIFPSTCNITNNVIKRNIGLGIGIYNSPQLLLSNNTIDSHYRATSIHISSSPLCKLDNNNCSNGYRGIAIENYSSNCLIENNYCAFNQPYGIYTNSHSQIFLNNSIIHNDLGMYLRADNLTILENTFISNTVGIKSSSAINISCTNNYFSGNKKGMYLLDNSYCEIENNEFINKQNSIEFSDCTEITITKNSFSYSKEGAHLVLKTCYRFYLYNNMFSFGKKGILGFESRGFIVFNNLFIANDVGIYLIESNNILIEYNEISESLGYGVFLNNSNQNCIYRNNFWNNSQSEESQAYDSEFPCQNCWYDEFSSEGNYWNNFDSDLKYYSIESPYNVTDIFPQSVAFLPPENISVPNSWLCLCSLPHTPQPSPSLPGSVIITLIVVPVSVVFLATGLTFYFRKKYPYVESTK